MADPKQDPLVEKANSLREAIQQLLARPNNSTSSIGAELQVLSNALSRVPQWYSRASRKPGLQPQLEYILALCQSVVASVGQIAQHGPEHNAQSEVARVKLASSLGQLLWFGLAAVEKDAGEIETMETTIALVLAEQKKQYDAVLAEAQVALITAKGAAERATESAKKVGITVQMNAFARARADNRRLATAWECRTAVVAALLFVGAFIEIFWGNGPPDHHLGWYTADNLSHYLVRALCVSLLSFLLVFSVKNYRSAKHNEVVNGHRAWALATFGTLRSPGNTRLDEVIMLHVAEAVFAPQPTGYDETETPGTHVTEQLLAVAKAVKG